MFRLLFFNPSQFIGAPMRIAAIGGAETQVMKDDEVRGAAERIAAARFAIDNELFAAHESSPNQPVF